jgi:hypothetical protein
MDQDYKADWRDWLRHLANVCFIGSYLSFERGCIVVAACCTLSGEILLMPSAFKHGSWSTILVCILFIVLAAVTICKFFFGVDLLSLF